MQLTQYRGAGSTDEAFGEVLHPLFPLLELLRVIFLLFLSNCE